MEKKLLEQAKDAVAKECGWSDFNDVIKHELDFSPNAIIDSVAIEYNRLCNEWISVDERLPEIDEEYLLYVYDEDIEQYFHSVGYFEKSKKVFNTDLCIEMKSILFWKPLPQPPK